MARRTHLQDILRTRATCLHVEPAPNSGELLFYPPGRTNHDGVRRVSYRSLYDQAGDLARVIQALGTFQLNAPVLLHFDDQWDTILWFWAVLLANGLPVLSSPLSNVEEHRHQHILSLSALLEAPICVTRSRLLPLFGNDHGLQLHAAESLLNPTILRTTVPQHACVTHLRSQNGNQDRYNTSSGSLAMLMLTSGSTGNAKAVCLTHEQVLASVAGKSSVRQLPPDKPFLNWIGLDHVGALIEIHLHALWLGVGQIHVNAADIISSPRSFLDIVSHHQVSRSFAPNFFLARLVSKIQSLESRQADDSTFPTWDLSSLTFLVSGGEANDVQTCVALSTLLAKYGAPSNVISPGFGMTETCAGSVYSVNCPEHDVSHGRTIASVGKCVPGIEMRIAVDRSFVAGQGTRLALAGEPGELQVRGPIVFKGYYRNPEATLKAFTLDNWFRTGDRASIDADGNLNLIGRTEETVININGIKLVAADIQASLEKQLGDRVARMVVFATRDAHTERATIMYVPKKWPLDPQHTYEIDLVANEICMLSSNSCPLIFSLREQSVPLLPTTSLGKISRLKMRGLFEAGKFDEDVRCYVQTLKFSKEAVRGSTNGRRSATGMEILLIDEFAEILGIASDILDIDTPLFEVGFTSIHLVQLKRRIEDRLGTTIPLIAMLKNPTARSLAAILQEGNTGTASSSMPAYDPVVVLRASGSKAPLWLIHPGVGEVLVFMGLVQHMSDDDRPLYALRARGFEGQKCYASIPEAVDTYVKAIRERQPQGPYALVGYSYGAMLAFEVTKRLNALSDADASQRVLFTGSLNLPPHIKVRMRQLGWNMCLLNLSYFLGLTSETYEQDINPENFRLLSQQEALDQVLGDSDTSRMQDLGLDCGSLRRWADIAYGLQSMAVDYEPMGYVDAIDVFHCQPLQAVAASPEIWLRDHLSKWADFSRTVPAWHHAQGAHYTMLSDENVSNFASLLKSALKARGI